MQELDLIDSTFGEEEELQFAPELRAGFPSPAEDCAHDSLDFNRDLIRHPEATFYGRVLGDSMIEAGICDGDIAVVDRACEPHNGSVVVAFVNNEFTIKFLDTTHSAEGYLELRPANKDYPTLRVELNDQFQVWGVVTHTIKRWG